MAHSKSEKAFENRIKRYLETEGVYHIGTASDLMDIVPCGYWVKRWGGGRYIPAGLPDLQINVCGICVDVEVKAENGVISDLQRQKIQQMQDAGCIGVVVRPSQFEAFKDLIEAIKYEERGLDASKLLENWQL